MKKFLLVTLVPLITLSCIAQNDLGKLKDMERISLVAWVPQQIESMPNAARSVLQNKLTQIVTQNGFGSTSLDNRFILTTNITILTKDITPTTPPMHAYTLEATLYIGDGLDGTLFSTTSITLKGVGETEQKAYMAALKGFRAKDERYREFLEVGKKKIIEYYNTRCDILIREAQALADQNKLEEAIAKLVAVPNVCMECFNKANDAIKPIYKRYIDRDCSIKLQEATALWNSGQDMNTARDIIPIVSAIDPDASCYPEAKELLNKVAKRVKELDEREWNSIQTQLSREYDLEKRSIEAARAVGVAYGSHQPSVEYKLLWW